jgi:hypothetical protein
VGSDTIESMLTALLLLSCGGESPAFTHPAFRMGRVRFDEEMRAGLAYAPGEDLDVWGTVASACAGQVGETVVGPQWTRHEKALTGIFQSECGAPLWVASPKNSLNSAPANPKDVLVVILDTFRADHMTPELTPRIWAHAQESWWPQSAWSPSSWTVPSVAALFTGRPPWAISGTEDHHLPEEQVSLWEVVPQHPSWMISANAYISSSNGFDQGLDRFARVEQDADVLELATTWWGHPHSTGRILIVQLMGSHLPYEPQNPPPGASPRVGTQFWDLDNWSTYTDAADQARIRSLYTASVQDLDRSVGVLLDLVGTEAITVLVSDHGEELFERGGFEHGHAFWESITRIHAAIRVPGTPPIRPSEMWSIQAIGQQIGRVLGVPEQPTWFPNNPNTVVHGYPLAQRDAVQHTWGARSEAGQLFTGPLPAQSGQTKGLLKAIQSAKSAAHISKSLSTKWCEVELIKGTAYTIPSKSKWPPDSPPSVWGSVSTEIENRVLLPNRSGTWRLSGIDGAHCETQTESMPWDFSHLEKEALQALGYLQTPDLSLD